MKYENAKSLLKANKISNYAGGNICGWVIKNKNENSTYFDNREEAEFYINGASHYELLPVYCDEVK